MNAAGEGPRSAEVSASLAVSELGLLRVTTNPPVPGKIIVDGVARDEWGLNWMKIAPGPHTVSFGDVYGFGTPGPSDVVSVAGVTKEAVGNYAIWANLRVTTNPPVPSTIYVNDVPSNDWGIWRAVPAGTYTVRWGAVAGWNPPASQTFTLAPGEPKHVDGVFTANPNAPGPDPSTYGLLRVTTNPALPATIYANGNALDEWGTTWVKVPPGTYTISFKTVYGFSAPAPKDVVVKPNGAVTEYQGNFVQHGSLKVETNPPVPATIYVDGIARNDWGMWQSMEPGTYEVSFGSVPGFVAPTAQTVAVLAGELTTVTGSYRVEWTRQFGTSTSDQANAVAVDASGVYVAGYTRGTLPGQTSAGSWDVFLRKYDAAGREVWTRQFGTSAFDVAFAVAADPSGVYVAGGTDGTFPGQTNAGGADAFLAKLVP